MNAKLLAGALALAALAFVAAFPGLFAPYPFGYADTIRFAETDAGQTWIYAPEPPSDVYPWGSDDYGYDLMTRLLWGLRWTLGIVTLTAFLRSALGAAIGVAAALRGSAPLRRSGAAAAGYGARSSAVGNPAAAPLAGVPSFVLAFFILYPITVNSPLGSVGLFFVQAAVLTAFELAGVAGSFDARARALLDKPFVTAAVGAGADRGWILRHHLAPYLAEAFAETFADQCIRTLQFVGRLGMFFVFIGGTTLTFDPPLLTSATGELAGLIGLYRARLLVNRWLLAYPLGAYLVIAASFGLFASGLKELLKKGPEA